MMHRVLKRLTSIPTPVIFLFSLLMAILLLWQQDALSSIRPAIRGADPWIIGAGLLLYLAGLALLCVRWNLLVKMVSGASQALRASEAFITSVAVNYAAPLSLALPSRAYLTKRALGLGTAETASITFWEVASDLAVLAVGTLIWILIGGWRGQGVGVDNQLVGLAVALLLGGLLAVFIATKRVVRLRSIVHKMRGHFTEALKHPTRRPRQTVLSLIVTTGYWIVQGGVIWLLLKAIEGSNPNLSLVLGLTTLPILVGMLSPVPGGAGVREALMIAVASVHGASEANVLLVGVTYRIALFAAIPILYGIIRILISMGGGDAGQGSFIREQEQLPIDSSSS
ncbi:MAG: flippase-like domain-containing protein [Thermomicrobiales bacterium]|nr:flippase-like domain-containing protein [Thermomicrobiales bacterium]MCO5220600.1 flippase-like domain-containing protein [Thermomicrobiales bacterium]